MTQNGGFSLMKQPWFEATEATRTSPDEDGSTEFRFWVLKVAL